jgi:hypothetical protein
MVMVIPHSLYLPHRAKKEEKEVAFIVVLAIRDEGWSLFQTSKKC